MGLAQSGVCPSFTFYTEFPGTYSITATVTDSSGATSALSNTATVTVNPAPTVTVVPTSWTMDVGQSKLFTAAVSDGSTYSSYLWYVDGELVQSGAASVMTFTPVSSGTYLINVTVTDLLGATCALSIAATVTVNAAPTVSIAPVGPLTLDVGQFQTFTATPTGGSGTINYHWYLGGSAVGY